MQNKVVSIIVPVYNVEKYLDRCVESIVNQTYKNLEIILVDDGSPDNCPAMCDEWAKKDNRIKVIHKENGGLSDARNFGIEVFTGDYILFVDSDDYIDLTMVEKMVCRIENDNTDMCVCTFATFKDGEEPNRNYNKQNEIITAEEALFRLTQKEYNVYFVIACCKLIKREVISDLRFVKGKIHEDEFMCHHLIGNCKTISCIYEPLYFYYTRQGSITKSKITISKLAVIEAMKDRIDYITINFPKLLPNVKALALNTFIGQYCISRRNGADKEILKAFRNNFLKLYKENKPMKMPISKLLCIKFFVFRYFKNSYYILYKIKNWRKKI